MNMSKELNECPLLVQASPAEAKIPAVARALREALLASSGGQGHFLRPILTSYAVVGDLEGALAVVKQVKESQLTSEGQPCLVGCTLCLTHPAQSPVLCCAALQTFELQWIDPEHACAKNWSCRQ